jgi:transcriptional regulator with XRE-family HTH domain
MRDKGFCTCCHGTGLQLDHKAIGEELGELRKSKRKTLKEVAGVLGVTSSFLCDLEHGKRYWTPKRIAEFKLALQ